jgi:hypothetical protein
MANIYEVPLHLVIADVGAFAEKLRKKEIIP